MYDAAQGGVPAGVGRRADRYGDGRVDPVRRSSPVRRRVPQAKILVTGVEDPATQAHSSNESLHLGVRERAAVAEALLLANLA